MRVTAMCARVVELSLSLSLSLCVYIYIYIERERDTHRLLTLHKNPPQVYRLAFNPHFAGISIVSIAILNLLIVFRGVRVNS